MKKLTTWRPSASISNLSKRAKIIKRVRDFFLNRGLLEVDTPGISRSTVTDVHIIPFQTYFIEPDTTSSKLLLYLVTSPEFHMKRLIAAGSGPIFQICRSFRNQELGDNHNPEFTILEWYQPNYDMNRIMNEVDELLQDVLNCKPSERFSYREIFTKYIEIDPILANHDELYESAIRFGLKNVVSIKDDRDTLLQLLFSMKVERNIGKVSPAIIYNFPSCQASLAKTNSNDHRVADRFEVYFKGIELANGFCELTDPYEQRSRFMEENRRRILIKLTPQPIDEHLLAALENSVVEYSGVALGIDRLVMLALNASRLSDVVAFSFDRI